ncbi:MAG TPA: NADH-quinone oxidoreductase subunit N [Ktedonobacteraceae bacterium]|nr:NADH-quinone oxidoreductase subunit N [Ktedonobacteraceae bacterium]
MTTFTFSATSADWLGIAPELVLLGLTLILMLVELVLPHEGPRTKHSGPANYVVLPIIALLGIVGAFAATITLFLIDHSASVFNHMLGADSVTLYAYLIILTAAGLGVFLSPAYLKRLELVHQGEYYALLLLGTVGMMVLAAATNFIMVFVGIEALSLALYILCAFVARRKTSQESGMKYFLLSSFASAFLLYGIALTYGATGNTSFDGINRFLSGSQSAGSHSALLLIALGLLTVGFAFKISAVPFQTWTPDVYQGAPAPVTAFMSVGTKAAALVAFARVFDVALAPLQSTWMPVVWVLAIVTIIGGNVLAVAQTNVKRLLAYSSIAHAGYLLIGVVVGGASGIGGILFYLFCYAFLNLGAFGVVSILEHLDNSGSSAEDLRGLWYRRPIPAGLLAFFLLGLAGFPPMAGFAAKYAIFFVALQGGHPELLIIGVLASILGMYYYLRVIATMFMEHQETAQPDYAAVPVSPVPSEPSRSTTRTTVASQGRGGVAVAVKPPTGKLAKPVVAATPKLPAEPVTGRLAVFSWIGLTIAALGTLAMGTILPFWLYNLAVQAAQSIIH